MPLNIPTTSKADVGVGVKSNGTRADALAERQTRVKTDVNLWRRKTPIYVTNATDAAAYHATDATTYHATGDIAQCAEFDDIFHNLVLYLLSDFYSTFYHVHVILQVDMYVGWSVESVGWSIRIYMLFGAFRICANSSCPTAGGLSGIKRR